MKRSQVLLPAVVAVLALTLSACGSSPTSPSGTSAGVNLHGLAMGQSSASASSSGAFKAMSTGSGITVTVQGTTISTTISGNGSFELNGLPAGTFTLVFTSNGVTLGTVTITSVPTQAEINLVVQITTTVVIMVKVEINGTDETDNENNNGTNDGTKTCLIDGGTVGSSIELEGSVNSASGKTFKMSVNGNRSSGLVSVDATSASFDCAGIKGTCDATLLVAGAKVHVSGTLTSCSLTAAQVKANQVKFQH
ncbi:MAG TPA: hypothetical protein VN461_17995 [Vicinamibacteria bacterium]|jgi:hypothetical protein|nr:hypothetical protein [Vicinamibacteria bacterium]